MRRMGGAARNKCPLSTNTILWRRLNLPGHEIATLEELDECWKLSGTALFLSKSARQWTVTCGVARETA
jgi:hypothetical protein